MTPSLKKSLLIFSAAAATAAAFLASCSSVNQSENTPPPPAGRPVPAPNPAGPPAAGPVATAPPVAIAPAVLPRPGPSNATNPKAYRQDAATHLYARNADRIYKGMLQPNLYAIGVLEVDIDRQGNVTAINWRRAPTRPEVVAEIVRTVRAAAPYPVPARLGKVTYTDIWLWDKSGKFQLDTLTEGQL